ncbi:MAG: 4Fe-4S dicluster domain-containing protein [Chloroflexota bacterium]
MKHISIKEEVCQGCRLCEVYCQVQHSPSQDILKTFKRAARRPAALVWVEEKKPLSFSVQCHHCDEPACVYACLTGALSKDPASGVVTVDEAKCCGCWTCILACPYGAIRQDTGRGKIAKCDLCPGEEVPVCVANCPNEALVYG